MSGYVLNAWYYACSKITAFRQDDEEKIHFVRYSRFEDEKELSDISRSPSANGQLSSNGHLPDFGEMDEHEADGQKDKITEWEAGWNITNSYTGMFLAYYIQYHWTIYWYIFSYVVFSTIYSYTLYKILLYPLDRN